MSLMDRLEVTSFLDGLPWSQLPSETCSEIIAPATGEVICTATVAGSETVDRAVHAAERAFDSWSRRPQTERSRLLLQLADAIEANVDELALLESMNVGKPLERSLSEIAFSADCLRFFAGAARGMEGRAAGEYAVERTSVIRREPLGVVAGIAPWNYPLMMAVWKFGPALAVGNTSVLKPSELTPLSALKLAEIAAGILPPGVMNLVTGDGATTGDALVRHPCVRMVSVTGSVTTGKTIARAAADTLKRVHLELGGNAAVMVFEDADIEAVVAKVITAGFRNAGQDCTAASRLLVQGKIFDELIHTLSSRVQRLRVGDPATAPVDVGPVISQAQRMRVIGMVRSARESGAQIMCGGEAISGPGYFIEPAVIAHPAQNSEIVQRETFGPVVTVQRFGDETEGLEMASDTPYGLTASVWTKDVFRCNRLARNLRFGTVWINDHGKITPEMPHGGLGSSGYGNDMSVYSLEEYTTVKHVLSSHI